MFLILHDMGLIQRKFSESENS